MPHRYDWGQAEHAQVLIVDFQSKSTPLIAQAVRETGLASWIVPWQEFQPAVEQYPRRAVILSGGPDSVYEPNAPSMPLEVLQGLRQGGTKLFGICYGAQVLVELLGGEVRQASAIEAGRVQLSMNKPFGQYQGGLVIMNHGDEVVRLPQGWQNFGSTSHCPYAFFGADELVGVQFHPEMQGCEQILEHFLFQIAGCQRDYTFEPAEFIAKASDFIREVMPEGRALVAVSGGVDSAVVYILMNMALGEERVIGVLVNNGFMAEGECEDIQESFNGSLRYVDASKEFYDAIGAIRHDDTPQYHEAVRRVVKLKFFEVFERAARQFEGIRFLGQGSNRADIQETETKLKGHHNVGELPEWMNLDIVEPLAGLYKLEIRKVANELGLPLNIVWRQPHPGPGNAIRILGRVTREKAKALGRANRILEEIVRKYYPEPESRPSQYYVALIDRLTRGLIGDEGVNGLMLMVRAVDAGERESYAAVTAFHFSPEVLDEIQRRLTSEVRMGDGTPIVRVVYEITGKPPSTTEPH